MNGQSPESGGCDPVTGAILRVIATLGAHGIAQSVSETANAAMKTPEQSREEAERLDSYRETVRNSVEADRLPFFMLADKVIKELEWPVDLVVVDGLSGHFVGNFLGSIIGRVASSRGETPPSIITVTNSRQLADYEEHQEAVQRYLASEIGKKGSSTPHVVVATEYVGRGDSMQRLGAHLDAAGAVSVDYAILCSYDSESRVQRLLGRQNRTLRLLRRSGASQVWVGRSNSSEPAIGSFLMREATGIACLPGHPTPLINEHAQPEIVQAAHDTFEELLAEYTRTMTPGH